MVMKEHFLPIGGERFQKAADLSRALLPMCPLRFVLGKQRGVVGAWQIGLLPFALQQREHVGGKTVILQKCAGIVNARAFGWER